MKGELKAGGLALVVKSTDTEDVGKCVTLVQLVQPGEEFTSPGGQYCRVPEHNKPRWLVSGDVIVTMRGETQFHGWATFPPENLLPIDGDPGQEPDQLAKDKPREVVA